MARLELPVLCEERCEAANDRRLRGLCSIQCEGPGGVDNPAGTQTDVELSWAGHTAIRRASELPQAMGDGIVCRNKGLREFVDDLVEDGSGIK